MLTKNVPRVFVPGSPGIPGTPGVPAKPAWDEVITVAQQVASQTAPPGNIAILYGLTRNADGSISPNYITNVNAAATGNMVAFGAKPPALHDIIVHHPATAAIPPTPGQKATKGEWMALNSLAWNGGAYSISRLDGSLEVSFSVTPESVGVVVGLVHEPTKQTYRFIPHGLYFHTNFLVPFENGQSVGPTQTFVRADVLTIRRINTTIQYLKNNVLFYTSTNPSVGSLIVEAVLYGPTDRVD